MQDLPIPSFPMPTRLCRILCEVGRVVSLGTAPAGERRYVSILGGEVEGPLLRGVVVPGGVDWQVARDDGVLEIDARYVLALEDGALVEVESRGLRHGPAGVMRRLAAGEAVAPDEYFFRTAMRFTTGAPAWQALNRTMAIGVGSRYVDRVVIDVFQLT